jgi:hypothetical protein
MPSVRLSAAQHACETGNALLFLQVAWVQYSQAAIPLRRPRPVRALALCEWQQAGWQAGASKDQRCGLLAAADAAAGCKMPAQNTAVRAER